MAILRGNFRLKTTFEVRLKANSDRQLERIKAENIAQLEKIKAEVNAQTERVKQIMEKQLEHFPSLAEAVYRSRNTAREMCHAAPILLSDQRSMLGDMALHITERLYGVRAFLPPETFSRLHEYKRCLQRFILAYDEMTSPSSPVPHVSSVGAIRDEFSRLDDLHHKVVLEIQDVLEGKH